MNRAATFTDQLSRSITISFPPQRIVSLVPSQTELLAHLGLEKEVVAITRFCIHPRSWFERKMRVGGTKQLHIEKIRQLQPDLIIGNKEENEQVQIEALMREFPVWMSDIKNLDEALDMIKRVGRLTGKTREAQQLALQIKNDFSGLQPFSEKKKAAYLIWQEPLMAAGGNTFVNDMLKRCGLINVFENAESRYPEFAAQQLSELQPDIILLSSEPFPFHEKHISFFKEICPRATVVLADGEMFSWYGSRLAYAAAYFRELQL